MNVLHPATDREPIRVIYDGETHWLNSYDEPGDLQRVAALDSLAFGQHVSLDVDYLEKIVRHGVVFGEEDGLDNLVSEAQVVLNPIRDADELIIRVLSGDQAYLEGFATHTEWRGKGLGKVLLLGAEAIAQSCGKRYILATSRLENVASLRTLIQQGYEGIGFEPNYYDAGLPGLGARVVLRQEMSNKSSPKQRIVSCTIDVRLGDTPDLAAQNKLQEAVSQNLKLTSVVARRGDDSFTVGLSSK